MSCAVLSIYSNRLRQKEKSRVPSKPLLLIIYPRNFAESFLLQSPSPLHRTTAVSDISPLILPQWQRRHVLRGIQRAPMRSPAGLGWDGRTPGLCSGQVLIGRLHSDYGQKEKVNRRLLGGLYSVFRNKLCVVVLHSGVLVGVPGVLRVCPR